MHMATRLAATAGATAMSVAALSGVAQAGTGAADGDGLGLTRTVSDTTGLVGGVTKAVTGDSRRSSQPRSTSGVRVRLPVRVDASTPRSRRGPSASASVRVHAGAAVEPGARRPVRASVHAAAHLCTSLSPACAAIPPSPSPNPPPVPPTPVPPVPPAPPQPPQPPNPRPPGLPPGAAGIPPEVTGVLRPATGGLPLTGAPIGALALIGAITLASGGVLVVGGRTRLRRRRLTPA